MKGISAVGLEGRLVSITEFQSVLKLSLNVLEKWFLFFLWRDSLRGESSIFYSGIALECEEEVKSRGKDYVGKERK